MSEFKDQYAVLRKEWNDFAKNMRSAYPSLILRCNFMR